VIIYLYKGSEGFMEPDSAYEIVKIEASDYREGYTFSNLEAGSTWSSFITTRTGTVR